MNSHYFKNNAFILIEILVALLILTVGVLFLIQALSTITRSNTRIRNNRLAILLIDNLYNRIYSGEEIMPGEISLNNKSFIWNIDVKNKEELLKNLIINVTWQRGKTEHKFSIEHTIIKPN